jgi:hypothetical protein
MPGPDPTSAGPAGPDASTAALPSEEVYRPDPGLARGRWESPAWVFWVVLVLAAAGILGWGTVAIVRRRARR